MAATAARSLATSPAVSFNPLFIHGGTGRGKILIGHAFLFQNRGSRVVSMSAEKFAVEFIRALKENDTIGFKQRLLERRPAADRRRPVHRRQGFHPGGILPHDERDHHAGRAAGDHFGQGADLDGIAPRILSRLSWGLVADINAADYELRFNIIVLKLEALPGVDMPRPVVDSLPGA